MMGRLGVAVDSRPLVYCNKTIDVPTFGPYTSLAGEEEGIDGRLAVDGLDAAHQGQLEVVSIFSQDQDLSELASLARQVASLQDRWIQIPGSLPDCTGANN